MSPTSQPAGATDRIRASRLRVPAEYGGFGVSVRQLFRLLIALAAAESNLPQALRVHFSFVEDQLLAAPGAAREHWLRTAGAGALVGNAITEPGIGAVDRYRTRLTPAGDGWLLNGTKYYSTGSLYADHILVAADRDRERLSVLVNATAAGVRRSDDRDGFGQRLTASCPADTAGVEIVGDWNGWASAPRAAAPSSSAVSGSGVISSSHVPPG